MAPFSPKKDAKDRNHYLLVTLAVYGHLIPMAALAKAIARHHKVTLAVSGFVVEFARKKGILTPDFETAVNVVALDDGILPGLTEEEAFRQSASKNPDIPSFLRDIPTVVDTDGRNGFGDMAPVTAVICDVFQSKLFHICPERNIPLFLFGSFSLASFIKFLYVTSDTPINDLNALESFPVIRPISEGPQAQVSGTFKNRALDIVSSFAYSAGFIFNAVRDIDAQILREIQQDSRASHMRTYCVGPLLDVSVASRSFESDDSLDDFDVVKWLDNQPPKSVVYVSFGTTRTLKVDRVVETAKALIILRKPFLWTIRKDHSKYIPKDLTDHIESTGLGMVVIWAAQKAVLAHPSVLLFITHCGWNSTTESVYYGKPLVSWPTFGDQLENALWTENIGVGKCLFDEESKGSTKPKNDVLAERIVQVVNEILQKDHYCRAQQWSDTMKNSVKPGGSSHTELLNFLQDSREMATTKSPKR